MSVWKSPNPLTYVRICHKQRLLKCACDTSCYQSIIKTTQNALYYFQTDFYGNVSGDNDLVEIYSAPLHENVF